MIGFDYTERIDPAALKAADCAVVFRYLSNPGWPKNLTAAEARELLAAGIPIVLNYETTADFMLGGFSAGVSCARSARAQATALGAPIKTKIYYSADFDATAGQLPAVLEFSRGVDSVDGAAEDGTYGGLRVAQAEDAAGHSTWQTIAWSGGAWDPRAVARQTGEQRTVGGVEVDVNEIISLASLGAWGGPTVGEDMPLAQSDADLLVADMLAKVVPAIAKAVNTYRDSTNEIQVNGKPYAATPYELAVGTWKATNDPGGAIPQMRGQLDNLFHRAAFDPAEFATALTTAVIPVIEQAVKNDLPADQIAAQVAELAVEHMTVTLGSK